MPYKEIPQQIQLQTPLSWFGELGEGTVVNGKGINILLVVCYSVCLPLGHPLLQKCKGWFIANSTWAWILEHKHSSCLDLLYQSPRWRSLLGHFFLSYFFSSFQQCLFVLFLCCIPMLSASCFWSNTITVMCTIWGENLIILKPISVNPQ